MQNRAHSKGRTPPENKDEKAAGIHTDKSIGISVLNKKAGIWQTDEHGQVKFREISPVRRLGNITSLQRDKTKKGRERNSHRSRSNPEVEFVAAALGAASRREERNSQKRKENHWRETEGKTQGTAETPTEQERGKSLLSDHKRSKEFDGEKLYQQVQQKKAQLSEPEQQHSGSKYQGGKPIADIGYHSNLIANQGDLSSAGNRGKIEAVHGHPRKEGRSERSGRNDLNQADTVGGGQVTEIRQGYSGATSSVNNTPVIRVNNVASACGSSDTGRIITDRVQSKDTALTLQNQGSGNQRGVVRLQGSNHRRGRRQERQDYQRRVERDRRFLPKEKSHSPRIRRSVNQRKPTGLFEGHVTSGRITQNNDDGQNGEPVGGVPQSHKPQKPDSGRHLSKAEVTRAENKGKDRENRTTAATREEVVATERKHHPTKQTEQRRNRTNNQEISSVKSEPFRPVPKPRFIIPPSPSEVESHQTTSPQGNSQHLYSQSQKQTYVRKGSEPSKSHSNEPGKSHSNDVKLKESHIGTGGHLSRLRTEVNKKTSLSAIPEGESNPPGLRVKTQPRFQKNQQGERKEGDRSPVPTRALHRQQHYRRATGRHPHHDGGEPEERIEKQRNIKSSNKQLVESVGSHRTHEINDLNRQKSATLDRERRSSPDHDQERHSFGLPRRSVSYSSLLSPSNDSLTKESGTRPPSSRSDIISDLESSRSFHKSNQPKISKYHQKTNLKQQKRISQSQTNLSKIGTSGKEGSSFFRKIGSQLDLRILKVLSPRKGSKPKEESSTISTDSSSDIRSEHRPQIRSPRYNPPSPSSPTFPPGREQPQGVVDSTILTPTSGDPGSSTDPEMYRRVTTSYQREFDNVRLRRSFDLGRDLPERPQSAMFFSQGDLPDFLDGATENHFRPRSESDVDISKLAAISRSRSGDRIIKVERSSSPGFRGVGSPSGRTGRDRRKQQQKMLSSGGNMVKMPRQPRPKRMKIILEYLSKGVVNCIELNKQKLEHMKQQLMEGHAQGRTSQGLQYNLEKHMKTTERHLRKLEFHLAKVEELQEQYEKELKVRDGGENILRAFSEANSSKAKGSMSEAKQRVKDCTQNMCHLEAELEVNLGVFIMKIEGIAGFARVCRGDVFEISFKYGFQKWKSKCKVEKDLSQTWENAEVMFYPMLADYLQIKVTEIRGIARSNIIIGSLEFDTSDFYQAEPQNLTIDVNEAGTIKLNVVISWSPFQIVEDELKILNKNSYSRRERSQTESSLPNYRPQSTVVPPPLTSKPEVRPTSASVPVSVSVDLDDVPMLTLAESLHNVNKLLEILHGQYVELKTLEKQVNSLESHLKKKSNIDTQGSMSSLSIKNALDSFSFLDEVDEGLSDGEEDLTEQTNTQNLAEKSTSVPKSKSLDHLQFAASKTDKDSHISASRPDLRATQRQERPSAKRSSRFLDLSEKRESRMVEVNEQRSSGLLDSPTVDSSFGSLGRSSMDPEPEPLTTGSESIDMVLVQHLMYTEYQLSHLGAFGPLKLKESIALDKLQKQAVIIEQLVMLSSSGEELFRADDILPELKLNPALLEFWEQCSEKHALYVNADLFLLQLDVKFGVKLRTNHPDIADDVFQSLGHRIIERPIDLLDPKAIITLFQYITFFAQEDRKNPERFINDLTNEFELTASLEPGNADLPKIVKKLPKEVLLPTGNLRALGLLLLEESDTIKNGVRSYLESICNNPKARQKAIHVYAECLEERDLSLRQAGCVALAAMRAREKLEQLVYLLQCDMDDVKQTVKEALMTFGEEGRQAYESLSIQPYAYSQQQHRNDGPLLTTEL